MALRNLLNAVIGRSSRPAAPPAGDMQVDFSYTQWRHAQMEQLVHNYHRACDSVESAPA